MFAILLLLLGVPWWTLLSAGTHWPTVVVVVGTGLFAAAFVGLPVMMTLGHGRRRLDWAAVTGDALLGAMWVLFVWSVLSVLLRLTLVVLGIEDPERSRVVAGAVLAVVVGLLAWGCAEAMRVPRIRQVDVDISRLGSGLEGLRVAVITDTHYGPIDRTRWSTAVVDRVNELDADVVCHVGDIADGTVDVREVQARPLAAVRARLARVYVTGNHEYFSEAEGWLDYIDGIGWDALHNRHIVVERDGDQLVIAGVDDATARASGVAGHGANLEAALADTDPAVPVMLLAHQPKQVVRGGSGGSGPADLRAHSRRADLAVQFSGPTRSARCAGVEQTRRAHAALHESRYGFLGSTVPGLRSQRDHATDAAPRALTSSLEC